MIAVFSRFTTEIYTKYRKGNILNLDIDLKLPLYNCLLCSSYKSEFCLKNDKIVI